MRMYDSRKKKRIFYLPISIIVTYALLLFMLISALAFIGPSVIHYLREYLYYEMDSPGLIIFAFFIILFLIIFLISSILIMNEKLKRSYENSKLLENDDISISTYSDFDSDRSYLEQRISELSDKLLSSQKRWEEVNHLIIASHNKNVNNKGEVSLDSFLNNLNINLNDYEVDRRLIFVLNPFHNDYINDYKTIKSTCDKLGFNALRGDEELIKGDVLSHIVKCILKSRIIIANINGRNPNVLYELGIAHAMNKPTILISHIDNDIPFDLKTKFIVIYKDEKELAEKVEKILLQILID